MDHTQPALHELAHTTSTQDAARELRQHGAARPFVVLTRDQRGGRGRLGRPWRLPPGSGLALTLARRSSLRPAARSWYPLVVALGVIEALRAEDLGTGVGLKWPNDILTAQGRKLGGILLEGDDEDGVLVGIGVNLAGPIDLEDPRALAPGWLWGEGGISPGTPAPAGPEPGESEPEEVRALARDIAEHVEAELHRLDVHGGDAMASGQRSRYGMACLTLGREVRFHAADLAGSADGTAQTATAIRIDGDGRLVLRPADGPERTVSAGDVRHVRVVPDGAPAPVAPPGRSAPPAASDAPPATTPESDQETHP
jgi:BirA family biotin operon repressor/biotin-[acetyl-CoA-carboxylase] ligase